MKYPGDNLKEGLKCLGYDKKISANEHHGNGSFPQKVFFDVLEMNILDINEEKQHLLWGYKTKVYWYDPRLQWPKECQKKGIETKFHILRSDFLRVLWNPSAVFQEAVHVGDPIMEKTITIGEVNR